MWAASACLLESGWHQPVSSKQESYQNEEDARMPHQDKWPEHSNHANQLWKWYWHLWCPSVCVSHLWGALERGQEARLVQIFSSAFGRDKHLGIHFKVCSMGIGGYVLSVLTLFLTNWSQYVVVYGCQCKLVNVVIGMP